MGIPVRLWLPLAAGMRRQRVNVCPPGSLWGRSGSFGIAFARVVHADAVAAWSGGGLCALLDALAES
eukprot:9571272-Heterocapsa_arctica.AAC.1